MKVNCEDRGVREGKGFERCYVTRLRKVLGNREILEVLRKEGKFDSTLP